jgi:hypothetical protein
MSYARLSKRPPLFKSFTGLDISEFDIISTEIESKYDENEGIRLSRRRGKEVLAQESHSNLKSRKDSA